MLTWCSWQREVLNALSTSSRAGIKLAPRSHITHIWRVAQLAGSYSILASFRELIAVQMRIAICWAHTSLPDKISVASISQAFPVAKATLIEGPIWVTELPRELYICRSIFEMTRVVRACAVELIGECVNHRVTEHALRCVTLVVYILHIASFCGGAIGLPEA